ncbi:MAG TPA: DUF2909 domain-containing protein [Pseudomonadales bacterium]
MWVKILVLSVILIIVYNLFRALYFMIKGQGNSRAMARSLTYRVAFSVGLFVLLIILFATGLIQPHGVS